MEHTQAVDTVDVALIARCRELLGNEAVGLSDHEVDLIRQRADAMAHVVVQIFLEKGATSR